MDVSGPQVVDLNSYKEIYEAPSVSQWTKSDAFYLSLKIAAFALSCTFFSYRRVGYVFAGYELARHIIQRLIMIPLYPLQSKIARLFFAPFQEKSLDGWRSAVVKGDMFPSGWKEAITMAKDLGLETKALENGTVKVLGLEEYGYHIDHIRLKMNGVIYSALKVSHEDNKKGWVLQATGNGEPIEYATVSFAKIYKERGFNVLLVNGPGAGRSEGRATPATMGDAQLAGIYYLETVLKAKAVIIAGRSLGGAAVGQAILRYPFKVDDAKKFIVIRQMSFSKTSDVSKEIVGMGPLVKKIVSFIIWWTGLEMDSVAASKKLAELGIHEVIVQGGCADGASEVQHNHFGDDHVIPNQASLGYRVFLENMNHKTYLFQSIQTKRRLPNGSIELVYDHMHENSIRLPGTLKLINDFGVSA